LSWHQYLKALPLHTWQSCHFIKYLLQTKAENTEQVQTRIGLSIANSWLKGDTSCHIHANISIPGKSDSYNVCWVFTRPRRSLVFPSDWLQIGVPVNKLTSDLWINIRPSHQQSAMLVKIVESREERQCILLWLGAIERLRPLDECPDIPISRYSIEGAALRSFLQRRFHFVKKLLFRLTDGEAMGMLGVFVFPKDQLPDEMIKHRTEVVEAVPDNQRQALRELGEWMQTDYMPGSITPEYHPTGTGMLFSEQPQFSINSIYVFIGPPEFGSRASQIGNSHAQFSKIALLDGVSERGR
jgi:hypothetical protein